MKYPLDQRIGQHLVPQQPGHDEPSKHFKINIIKYERQSGNDQVHCGYRKKE